MKYYVYCLFRVGEHQPFYVGATHQPKTRAWQHRERQRIRYRQEIRLVVWETFGTIPETARYEVALIRELRSLGISLANATTAQAYHGPQRRRCQAGKLA